MKNLLLFACFCFVSTVFSQSLHSDKYEVHVDSTSLDESKCAELSSLLENEIASIQFVSLLPFERTDTLRSDSVLIRKVYTFKSIFVDHDSVDFTKIKNRVTLQHRDVNRVMQALYEHREYGISGVCYMPRHGISFLSQTGDLLGFIEICFECSGLISTDSMKVNSLYSDQYDTLERIFRSYMGEIMNHQDIH